MLDRDELLPVEQANPGLVQELRTIYQIKQKELQILNRVRERLAQNADPLPLPEPVQGPRSIGSRTSVPPIAASLAGKNKKRWLQPLNALAAVIVIGILVGALVLTLTSISRTTVGTEPSMNAIQIVLATANKSSVPSHAAMEVTAAILSKRLASFGLPGGNVYVITTHGQPGILVELPRLNNDESQGLHTLLAPGTVAFWDTGATPLATGQTLVPSQYTSSNGGTNPNFTGNDLDPSQISVGTDSQTGQFVINFEMKGAAIGRFATFTNDHIGDYLTVTLDKTVISSAVINSEIDGPSIIQGTFTQQEANAIMAVLKYGELPVPLQQLH